MVNKPTPVAPAPLQIGETLYVTGADMLPDGFHRLVFFNPGDHRHIFKRLVIKTLDKDGFPVKSDGRRRIDVLGSLSGLELRALETKGLARRISLIEPARRLVAPGDLKKGSLKAFNKKEPILVAMCHPDVLHNALIEKSTKKLFSLAEHFEITPQQAKRLFHRLLDSGLNPQRAAMSGHSRAGKQKNRCYSKKQGRTRKMVKNELGSAWKGLNTDDGHRRDIVTFIKSAYDSKISLNQNFRNFRGIFAVRQIHALHNGSIVKETIPEEEYLTYSQFSYHFKKLLSAIHGQLNPKLVKEITQRSFRIHTGNARAHIQCPGHTLLIDSTAVDVHLLCSFDRSKLIGRPILYFVVDALTSTIVGLHISLRPPSGVEAKIALYGAMMDKTRWLNRYGLGAYSHLFPRAPHPYEIIPDRAELHSVAGREIAKGLSINIGLPAAYMAAWKGIVERLFRTTNNFSIHWIPGSTQGRARERGERDVRLDAVLTLDEFVKIILYGVLLWNKCGNTTAFVPPEALADDGTPGPAGYFDWGLQNLHGSPRYVPDDELIVRFLEPQTCRVMSSGIELDRNRWVAEWMKQPELTLSGLIHKDANLYRDPYLPKDGYVRLKNEEILRPVSMFDMPIDGTSFDIEEYQAHEQAARAIHQLKSQSFETSVMHQSYKIVETAKRLTKQAKAANPQSQAAYIAGLVDNRAAEIRHAETGAAHAPSGVVNPPQRTLASQLAGSDFFASLANFTEDPSK